MVLKKLLLCLPVALLFACGGSDKPTAADFESTVSEADAQKIYTMKCALCHGADGKLMISGAPDLTKSTKTFEERVALITYGKGTMPPQKEVLSTAEIKAVAKYIEAFTE